MAARTGPPFPCTSGGIGCWDASALVVRVGAYGRVTDFPFLSLRFHQASIQSEKRPFFRETSGIPLAQLDAVSALFGELSFDLSGPLAPTRPERMLEGPAGLPDSADVALEYAIVTPRRTAPRPQAA